MQLPLCFPTLAVAACGFLSLPLTLLPLPFLPQPPSSADQCTIMLSLVWEGKRSGAERAAASCCAPRQTPGLRERRAAKGPRQQHLGSAGGQADLCSLGCRSHAEGL